MVPAIHVTLLDNLVKVVNCSFAFDIEQKWYDFRLESVNAVPYQCRLCCEENIAWRILLQAVHGQYAQISNSFAICMHFQCMTEEDEHLEIGENINNIGS